ncbi:MAG TPA: hypothetical protein VG937_36045 [Polyangiaceae bacterium]|nr:hypothetical protein [Polyangiaceae bacterium]
MKSSRPSQPASTFDLDFSFPHGRHGQRRPVSALGAALLAIGLASAPVHAEEGARAQAERVARELGAQTADKALLAPLLDKVRSALERAANARRAGDQRHGSELEALALELAQSAADLVRERQAHRRVDEAEQKAQAAETRVLRARALVEQTAARRGRAAERLRELEAEKANPTPGAATPPAKPMPDPKTAVPAPKSAAPAAKPASEKKPVAPTAKPGKASAGSP